MLKAAHNAFKIKILPEKTGIIFTFLMWYLCVQDRKPAIPEC